MAIQTESVQTWLARRLTSYLSSELGTKVNVERVKIRFVKSVLLEKLFVADQHGDTLIYAGEMSASIRDFSTKQKSLSISRLELKNGSFRLIRYGKEEHDNLYFLTHYFSSADTSTTGSPWKIVVSDVELSNMDFVRDIDQEPTLEFGVDFSHLHVSNIHGRFRDFHVVNDSVFVKIDHLKFDEKSGFKINEFAATAKISGDQIRLDDLAIRSEHSSINSDLTFNYDSFPDFDEFTQKIRWNVNFRQTTVSFADIAFFAPELKGWNKHVQINGPFKGTVGHFKGKNVSLAWGENSYFRGNIAMTGLPSWDDTYMDILADEVRTDKADMEWIQLPPFESGDHLKIPDNLAQLGNVFFKGKFTGFSTDFVAYGSIKTDIGLINSDLNMKAGGKNTEYKGHLSAYNFNIGKISGVPNLENVSFNADVKGSGLQLNTINASLNGKIESITYKNYAYKNILLDGQIAKKLFNGSFVVQDPNLDMEFSGSIDFRKPLPEFDFVTDVKHADLDTMNLFNLKVQSSLQTHISTHFIGNKPDNLVGSIVIDNTNFKSEKELYHLNKIDIFSDKLNEKRNITIHSDLLEADFHGEFEFATLASAFSEIIPRFLPSVILPQKAFESRQNFSFDIRLKNLNLVSELFLPSWDFAANSTLKGNFNSIDHRFRMDLYSPFVKFKSWELSEIHSTVDAGKTDLLLNLNALRLSNAETPYVELPQLFANAKNDRIDFSIKLADQDTFIHRAHLDGNVLFSSSRNFNVHLDSTMIMIQNELWKLNAGNAIAFDSSGIGFSNFRFEKEGQEISIDGRMSSDPSDALYLQLNKFDLSNVNPLLKSGLTRIGGKITGKLMLKDVFKNLLLETDLSVASLSLNDDTLGNSLLKMKYISEENVLSTDVTITRGSVDVLDVKGNYYLARDENSLDMNVKLNNFYIHSLERYMDGILKDVHGRASADLHLTGTFSKPDFEGKVDLSKTSLIVAYLNTRYSFSASIDIQKDRFTVQGLKLIDSNNNEAVASGSVSHDYFRNFNFDLNVRANRFQVLNTTLKENNLYYGVANATGFARFYGPLETMNMDISLSPDKGSVLNIPLNTSSELSANDFITFVDRHKDTTTLIARTQVNLSGIRLNMNLDMNPNALINIIFDEKIGDVISGTGNGSLRLDINTSGAFNMYGNYVIDKGDYLFTLQNLINKKFTIEPGGKINWSGDPYEASIDLSAVYVVNTSSLYNVVPDSVYKRRLPVDCRLFLSNKLMNPTITYEISVRGLDPTAQSVIKTILNNEQEINKQMFGLLVLNQFVPPNAAGQVGRLDAGAGAGASASELLSNQVSNWLGQLSKDVNIGLNYRAKDTYSSEEIQLMFSKSLFKDRLTVEGNVGYLNSQNAAAVNTGNSNVVGDFYAEWKLNEDGRIRVKGFNRSNAGNIITYSQSPYTQGLGLFYRQEFNSFADLLVKWRISQQK